MIHTTEVHAAELVTTELRIASWNAALKFGPGRNKEQLDQAFGAIAALGNGVHVLGIAELTGPADDDHLQMIQDRMKGLGFDRGKITNGVRDDELKVGLWIHRDVPGRVGYLALKGLGESGKNRYLPQAEIPDFGRIMATHMPSDSGLERLKIAHAFMDAIAEQDDIMAGQDSIVGKGVLAIGDWNEAYANDSKSTRLMRALHPLVKGLPDALNINVFDRTRHLRWAIGVVARACAMTDAATLKHLAHAGFTDAAPSRRPKSTVHLGPFDIRVDHFIGNENVFFEGYEVLQRAKDKRGKPLSDHSPIIVTARVSR